MRRLLRALWWFGGAVLITLIGLTFVSPIADRLDLGGPNLTTDARFFAAMLAPLLGLVGAVGAVLGAAALRALPADERSVGRRALIGGVLALLGGLLWLALSIGLLVGGLIPH
ncbi:MAG: hypothetical protein H6711_09530 [Myxococcales bacterium]|nr:hypothetical protein [Myxococcales bacterium]